MVRLEWFEIFRRLILGSVDALRWIVPIVAGAVVAGLMLRHRSKAMEPAVLITAFALAAWGQVFVARQEWVPGAALYTLAAALLFVWLVVFRGDEHLPELPRLNRLVESVLVAVVLMVAAYARFYRLDQLPYGVEGDEAKWSIQVAAAVFAGEDLWDAAFRRAYVPYTYWVEGFFYRVMGIDISTARWQVALLSLISTGVFYFAARRVLGAAGALVAAFLMAVSIVDVSAARFAHVETQIKLPLILMFACLVFAGGSGQPWYWFVLTGFAATLGLLTFDTFFLAPAVAGLWLMWRLWSDHQVSWRGRALRLGLFLGPIALVAQRSWSYIDQRRGDHEKSVSSLTRIDSQGWEQLFAQVADNLGQVFYNFSAQRWGDFFFNRDGPVVEAALVPLIALGLVYLIVRWRRGDNGLVPLWFMALFFPAAVIFGHPFVRVFYPAFPAMYLLAAAALLLFVRGVLPLDGRRYRSALIGSVVGGLLFIGSNSLYVFFHEMKDFSDRVDRRQLMDTVGRHAGPGKMLYVPYMPLYDDFVEWERQVVRFAAWSKVPVGQERDHLQFIPYTDLLRTIGRLGHGLSGATVLYDRGPTAFASERQTILDAATRCFPGAAVQRGQRFDAVVIPENGWRSPACVGVSTIAPVEPLGEIRAGGPISFTWTADPAGAVATAKIEIARQVPGVVWIEAENAFQSPHWYLGTGFAPGFSGRGFVGDHYGARGTSRDIALPGPGRYTVWARTHRRLLDDMPLAIGVGDQRFPAARHTDRELDQWLWERLGAVDATSSDVPVTLERQYTAGRHMSVFIDTLVLTMDPTFHPSIGLWPIVFTSPVVPAPMGRVDLLPPEFEPLQPVVVSTAVRWPVQVIAGNRLVSGLLLVDDPDLNIADQEVWRVLPERQVPGTVTGTLAPGHYRWRVQVFNGERLVGPDGQVGQWSDWTEFDIR